MGLWWLMEDLRETGTIGIGGRAGSFICARFIILSGYHRGLDLFRAAFRSTPGARVFPALASRPYGSQCILVFLIGLDTFVFFFFFSFVLDGFLVGRVPSNLSRVIHPSERTGSYDFVTVIALGHCEGALRVILSDLLLSSRQRSHIYTL